ncbi:hypothetical protein GGD55_002633 [Rhizobium giardinii]|uniref:Uncharacterized protein n=1 Tax=Rhizobium giardinii TaxID=56731 RepID=A0A7W8UBW6_9HYPH|nr:hypothetical protein [Rhizobium giardinii]
MKCRAAKSCKQSGQVRTLRRYLPERLIDGILRKFNGFTA